MPQKIRKLEKSENDLRIQINVETEKNVRLQMAQIAFEVEKYVLRRLGADDSFKGIYELMKCNEIDKFNDAIAHLADEFSGATLTDLHRLKTSRTKLAHPQVTIDVESALKFASDFRIGRSEEELGKTKEIIRLYFQKVHQ